MWSRPLGPSGSVKLDGAGPAPGSEVECLAEPAVPRAPVVVVPGRGARLVRIEIGRELRARLGADDAFAVGEVEQLVEGDARAVGRLPEAFEIAPDHLGQELAPEVVGAVAAAGGVERLGVGGVEALGQAIGVRPGT